ncbi:uncharacterized protein LOC131500085 [Neofelis nebulosa]|uniref:uncharacterized protein LOC131500085 n=1 Tax=Neofelis nebulosa TaxID=61452 RepID=UPI00272C6D19|nr:uncharacterized protein LOC131500085 [Neofelis nebulosa]
MAQGSAITQIAPAQQTPAAHSGPAPRSQAVIQDGACAVSFGSHLWARPRLLRCHSRWRLCRPLSLKRLRCKSRRPPVDTGGGTPQPLPLGSAPAAKPTCTQDGACAVSLSCHLSANSARLGCPSTWRLRISLGCHLSANKQYYTPLSFKMAPAQRVSAATYRLIALEWAEHYSSSLSLLSFKMARWRGSPPAPRPPERGSRSLKPRPDTQDGVRGKRGNPSTGPVENPTRRVKNEKVGDDTFASRTRERRGASPSVSQALSGAGRYRPNRARNPGSEGGGWHLTGAHWRWRTRCGESRADCTPGQADPAAARTDPDTDPHTDPAAARTDPRSIPHRSHSHPVSTRTDPRGHPVSTRTDLDTDPHSRPTQIPAALRTDPAICPVAPRTDPAAPSYRSQQRPHAAPPPHARGTDPAAPRRLPQAAPHVALHRPLAVPRTWPGSDPADPPQCRWAHGGPQRTPGNRGPGQQRGAAVPGARDKLLTFVGMSWLSPQDGEDATNSSKRGCRLPLQQWRRSASLPVILPKFRAHPFH